MAPKALSLSKPTPPAERSRSSSSTRYSKFGNFSSPPSTPSTAASSTQPPSPASSAAGALVPRPRTKSNSCLGNAGSQIFQPMRPGTLEGKLDAKLAPAGPAPTSPTSSKSLRSTLQSLMSDDAAGVLPADAGADEVHRHEPGPCGRAGLDAGACRAAARRGGPATDILSMMRGTPAPVLLRYLRLCDIVALQFGSAACSQFCCSSESRKLIVPVFSLQRCWLSNVDLPSVEVLYADNMRFGTLDEQDLFMGWLGACASLHAFHCSHNENLLPAKLGGALAKLPGLAVLDLAHNELAVDKRGHSQHDRPLGALFSAVTRFVRVIDLSYNSLRDSHAESLVEALDAACGEHDGCLEQLVLRSNSLGNTAGFAFGQLMRRPAGRRLRRLDMRTNQVESTGACAMLSALKSHAYMREVRIGYNRRNTKQDLETAGLACLLLQQALSAKGCNQLALLDLNNVRIGDHGTKKVATELAANQLLKQLYVTFNDIGPEGAQALAKALKDNSCLEALDIRDNEVLDEGADALACGLKGNVALSRLLVARNEIGTKGAEALAAAVRRNPQLRVDFGASGVDSRHLQDMMRNTPRYGINWWS